MAKVRLGDIATVVTKGTTPTTIGFQFEDSGINFVKIESISEDGTFLKEKFSHISDECNVQMRRSQLQENDILFSIAGAIGRSAIVTKEILPANTNQALAIIRVPKGKIDYNYLLYALSSSAINQQATQHQQGVAQLNISLKNVSDFLLPIYTEAMQKRIVHNLKKIDKLIFLRKQQLEKLDELVKARFVEMFEDISNDKKVLMQEVCKIITDGTHQPPKFVLSGVPFLFVSNIVTNEIHYDAEKFISDETYNELIKRTPIEVGDILLSTVGSYGHPAIVKVNKPFCFQRHIAYLKPNSIVVNSEYLRCAILSADVQRQIDKRVKGIAQKTLNLSDIRKLEIPLPPLSLQNDFAAFVERVDQQKQTVQQSLDKLELMKKALMQEYFG